MLKLKTIKIIYCYLVCFFMVMYILFKSADLTHNILRSFYFESTYTPGSTLMRNNFGYGEQYKGLSAEKIESLRQEAIEEDKQIERKRLAQITMLDWPYLLYSVLFLVAHIVIIRRTKES